DGALRGGALGAPRAARRRAANLSALFFQAEDGIRVRTVTGVQTCALPIYTARVQTSNGSSYAADITSSAAGGQHGTATFSCAADWSAVCAVFHPYPATAPEPPSTPTGLEATSVASTRVALAWSPPSTGSVAGYTVY